MAKNDLKKLRKFDSKIKSDLKNGLYTNMLAQHIHAQLVHQTPFDKGIARSNWFPSVSSPSTKSDVNLKDPLVSRNMIPKKILNSVSLFLTNNLPYINRLENGHSSQKPNGFIKQALKNASINFEQALKNGNR